MSGVYPQPFIRRALLILNILLFGTSLFFSCLFDCRATCECSSFGCGVFLLSLPKNCGHPHRVTDSTGFLYIRMIHKRMVACFRLLNLPDLALKNVLIIKEFDCIKFAMCSSRCRKLVKFLKLGVRELTITHTSYQHCISIEFKPFSMYTWYFTSLAQVDDLSEFCDECIIDGNIFPSIKTYSTEDRHNSLCADYVSAVDIFVTFLMDLFVIDHIIYDVNADGFSNFKEFFVNHFVNGAFSCDEFDYGGRNETEPLPVISDDVLLVLDNLPVNIKLCISGRLPQNFHYDKPLRHNRMDIEATTWLTREHLFNSTFEQLVIDNSQILTFEDTNEFVRKWLNHELQPNLQWIFMFISYNMYGNNWMDNENNLRVLFDGLEVKEFDKTRNVRNNPKGLGVFRGNQKALYDIRRNDNMVASFSLDSRFVAFNVWKNQDHGESSN